MLTALSLARSRRIPSSTRLLSLSTLLRHSHSLPPHPSHTLSTHTEEDEMTHELQVEGDKVVERDEQGNVISEKVRPLTRRLTREARLTVCEGDRTTLTSFAGTRLRRTTRASRPSTRRCVLVLRSLGLPPL